MTPNQLIARYTYGASRSSNTTVDVTTGQVTKVEDGLTSWGSGPTYLNDQFSYLASGSGLGQVATVQEVWPGPSNSTTFPTTGYTVSYTYTGAGDRDTVTYSNTASGTQKWQYADYCSVGSSSGPSRAFQTMRQLDGTTGAPQPEEFHYLYDGGGRLEAATFAMTPASGYTPTGSNPWYDSTHKASKKARVIYDNDARSCLMNLTYTWDDPGSSWNIQSWQCGYDGITAQKTSSATQYWNSGTWGGPSETFGYDVQRGFLTSYSSNDGASGKPTSESWGYDAAGNRTSYNYGSGSQTDAVVDNLNRATSIQGLSCTNDILASLYLLFLHMAPWAGAIIKFEPETLEKIHQVCELVDESFGRYKETQEQIEEALEPEGLTEESLATAGEAEADINVLSIEMRVDFVIQFEQAEVRIGLLIKIDAETEEL